MRGSAMILLVAYLAVLLVPTGIVAHFMAERTSILNDLCVQRMVPEGQRTCHGQCYLMKKLGRSDQRGKELPPELRELRVDEALLAPPVHVAVVRAPLAHAPSRVSTTLLSGCVAETDPVPWG